MQHRRKKKKKEKAKKSVLLLVIFSLRCKLVVNCIKEKVTKCLVLQI